MIRAYYLKYFDSQPVGIKRLLLSTFGFEFLTRFHKITESCSCFHQCSPWEMVPWHLFFHTAVPFFFRMQNEKWRLYIAYSCVSGNFKEAFFKPLLLTTVSFHSYISFNFPHFSRFAGLQPFAKRNLRKKIHHILLEPKQNGGGGYLKQACHLPAFSWGWTSPVRLSPLFSGKSMPMGLR